MVRCTAKAPLASNHTGTAPYPAKCGYALSCLVYAYMGAIFLSVRPLYMLHAQGSASTLAHPDTCLVYKGQQVHACMHLTHYIRRDHSICNEPALLRPEMGKHTRWLCTYSGALFSGSARWEAWESCWQPVEARQWGVAARQRLHQPHAQHRLLRQLQHRVPRPNARRPTPIGRSWHTICRGRWSGRGMDSTQRPTSCSARASIA
jgi:hypothetical protein